MNNIIQKYYKRIKDSEIGRRVFLGSFWSLFGTAAGKVLVLLSGILCARVLGKAEYGEFGMVRSTMNMFVVFGVAGLGLTAAKYISEYLVTNIKKVTGVYIVANVFALLTGLIVSLLVFIFSDYLAVNTLNAPQLTTSIRISSALLFLAVINGAQSGTLSGFESFKEIAIITFIGSAVESVGMLVGAYLYGVNGAIIGLGIGYLVIPILNQIAINKELQKRNITATIRSISSEDLKVLYKFSIPAALSSFLVAPVLWIMRTILVKSSGFEELASFEAAEQWRVIILFIPGAVSRVILPILSSLSEGDSKRYWKAFNLNLFINVGVAFVFALIVALFSQPIMSFYGKEYSDYITLIILSLSCITSSGASVIGSAIASRSKMWAGFSFNLIWAILSLVFTLIFVSCFSWGAKGLAAAIFCSYLIHAIIQYVYLRTIKLNVN